MTFADIFLLTLVLTGLIYSAVIGGVITGFFCLKKPESQNRQVNTRVGIIIPARNEEAAILDCLGDILEQDFPPDLMEIIIVDDHSTDRTASLSANFRDENPNRQIILLQLAHSRSDRTSKKAGIEEAVKYSSGELIITTDADTRRGKRWIRSIVEYYEENHPSMILAPVTFTGENSFFRKLQFLEFTGLMAVTAGSCRAGFPLMCNGANLAYEKKAFLAVHGYRDNSGIASGDDIFLMRRFKKFYGTRAIQFLYSENSVVYTAPSGSLKDFFFQRIRWVSKSRSYFDLTITSVAGVTWLFSLLLIAGICIGIMKPLILYLSLLLVIWKLLIELVPVSRMTGFFKKNRMLYVYPVAGLLNIFYTALIGIAGLIIPFEWKGRKVKVSFSSRPRQG